MFPVCCIPDALPEHWIIFLLHCMSAATRAAYQHLWVVFKHNFKNSGEIWIRQPRLYTTAWRRGDWGNLTEVKWFAWSLWVNVTYGTSCQQAHRHSASSYSSLDVPTSNLHRKFEGKLG